MSTMSLADARSPQTVFTALLVNLFCELGLAFPCRQSELVLADGVVGRTLDQKTEFTTHVVKVLLEVAIPLSFA